ncbi:hypothetical protein FB545_4002 [Peribacillus frigoritolerans]|nr:hypothetical protein FB545_4002 [Peribacillus frigoritolerans]
MSLFCFRRTNADYFHHCLIVNQEKVAIIDTGFYCESKGVRFRILHEKTETYEFKKDLISTRRCIIDNSFDAEELKN